MAELVWVWCVSYTKLVCARAPVCEHILCSVKSFGSTSVVPVTNCLPGSLPLSFECELLCSISWVYGIDRSTPNRQALASDQGTIPLSRVHTRTCVCYRRLASAHGSRFTYVAPENAGLVCVVSLDVRVSQGLLKHIGKGKFVCVCVLYTSALARALLRGTSVMETHCVDGGQHGSYC